MPKLPEAYAWEAEREDGSLMTIGGDLTGCRRISFIPQIPGLPRHDLVGLRFVRRFGRGFVRGLGGGPREYLHCVVCDDRRVWVSSVTGTKVTTGPDAEVDL